MRELLLLDLAGFRCGIWKEDILSHEEQIIHWLTDNNGAVTAIAMMGAHPVSLADLSYCIGLPPARRAGRYPVLVPVDHDFSVSFVVEQEAGMAQVPSSAIFSLPAYLQTPFIDSCVQRNGKLIPLINIRAIHCWLSTTDYTHTPPEPQFCISGLKEEREERASTLTALRVFTCKKKSFAASADYFFSKQAVSPGVLTPLPLLPEFVRGITLHSNRMLTVFDIPRYLQLSSEAEGDEKKWLIGEVEGQGFAFVVDADLGLLPAGSAPLAVLPLLVRSDWQQRVAFHDRKIIPVLDFKEMLARKPDECSQTLPRDLGSDGRFEVVFGKQQVEIVEFSLCKMVHALPDLEVADIIPFSHCQRLAGARGLVAGVTLYRKELLPVIDPARSYGRESSPSGDWKLLLIYNGDLRVLVLVEDVLGKRSLNVSEQRALPFTVPHSSVYGCYPVAGRVGLIFNILALTAYFDDDQQISELSFFADDLLPPVTSFFEEQKDDASVSSLEFGSEDPVANDWEVKQNASVLLAKEQDTLVQSVVASMLSRKEGAIGCTEELEEVGDSVSDIWEESDDVFSSVVAAMLSRKGNNSKNLNGLDSEGEAVGQAAKVASDVPLEASPVLLTEERDALMRSTLAARLLREGEDTSVPEIHEELREEQAVDAAFDKSQHLAEPLAIQADSTLVVLQNPLQEDEERGADGQQVKKEEGISISPEHSGPLEGTAGDGCLSDVPVILFTDEQDPLLQSSLSAVFSQQKDGEDRAEKLAAEREPLTPPKKPKEKTVIDELACATRGDAPDSDFQEKDEGSIEGLQNAGAINSEFSSSAARDAESNTERKVDSIDGADEQMEKKARKELVPAIEVTEGGVKEEDLPLDVPEQLKDGKEALLVPDTWNVFEDADAFPELKDFSRQVPATQQADSPLFIPHDDFVKQVKFPSLVSPDPREIKKKLDKARQKERDILFKDVVHEPVIEPQALPQQDKESRRRFRLWMILLLPGLVSGFLLWLFVFKNEDVSRGKSIKSKSQLSKISSVASPNIQGEVPVNIERGNLTVKNVEGNNYSPSVVSSPALSKSESTLAGQEETEEEISEAPVDQPVQAIPEQISTNNLLEDFPEKIGADSESVSRNGGTQQGKTEYQGQDQKSSIESVHGNDDSVDEVVSKNAVSMEKDPVEGSAVAFSDNTDAEDESQEEGSQKVVMMLLQGIKRAHGELDITPSIDWSQANEQSMEQKLPVPAAYFFQGISLDTVGDGKEAGIKGISVRRIVDSSASDDRSKWIVKENVTVQSMPREKKQVDVSLAQTIFVSMELAFAPSTETDRSGDLRKETRAPLNQKKSSLMSPAKGTSGHTRHTVNKGDTLWNISEQYTGSGFNYLDVAKKNKIANPDLIYPAQQVTLPAQK
ncbi:Chemotaxis signal transduction protein [Candidatus Electrothrix aarhusensis]|uniref:Chemotaxis signal transduction protein n=1 Tax=Candidatus Electrothrix aarhusensis TaxID=1859131 RepID=A0A444IZU4_9BACT|nr:Chemotaxis signal transduction protein [Candidatus Electrothrix aarhusensis]